MSHLPSKYSALEAALLAATGATFIGIDTRTQPKLTGGKKNPHLDRVHKITIGSNVAIFQNKNSNAYDNMVRRRLVKEGKNPESFRLSPRAWGHRIPNTPFVENNGKYYLEVIYLKSGETYYTLDGVRIDKRMISGLPSKGPEGNQGGLNDKVIIRTFSLDSLMRVTVNHETFNF